MKNEWLSDADWFSAQHVRILPDLQQPAVVLVESQNSINLHVIYTTLQPVKVRIWALWHDIISIKLLSPLVGLPVTMLAPVRYATPQDTRLGWARKLGISLASCSFDSCSHRQWLVFFVFRNEIWYLPSNHRFIWNFISLSAIINLRCLYSQHHKP